ncbi:MAG: OsmC family protein [Planctomycetaceae bacterium]
MNSEELRNRQAPLKARYKDDPQAAFQTLRAEGVLSLADLSCAVPTPGPLAIAGLHPAAGGEGTFACSGDMLLQALAGCAGVTLLAVATALQIPIRGGRGVVEGDLDFRGTLGVAREVPVGFLAIRVGFQLAGDLTAEQRESLRKLSERYCVVAQTLRCPVEVTVAATP